MQGFILPEIAAGCAGAPTRIVTELLADIDELHAPELIFVIVIVEFPAVVSPVAVNVPLPAVPTVIEAVSPVCTGKLVLYVTV